MVHQEKAQFPGAIQKFFSVVVEVGVDLGEGDGPTVHLQAALDAARVEGRDRCSEIAKKPYCCN
jgi:hypothetical protein